MSILLPALRRVRNQAQSVRCTANLRQWALIFKFYTDDNDGYFNEGWGYADHHPGQPDDYGLWMNALRPYYKDAWALLLCPTAKVEVLGPSDMGTFKAWYRDLLVPGGGTFHYVGSYCINNWTNYMIADRPPNRYEQDFWKNVQRAKGVNNIPVFADGTWHDSWPQETDTPPPTPDDFGWGSPGTSNEIRHFCINRHAGFVNFLFMDWSVRKVGLKELWTLKWHRRFNTANRYTKAGGVTPGMWPQWMRKFQDY